MRTGGTIRRSVIMVTVTLFSIVPVLAGAWGVGPFENDPALDWLADLVDQDDTRRVYETLEQATAVPYIDVDIGSAAIAAAEVVAAFRGRPSKNLPKELTSWVGSDRHGPSESQLELARKVVQLVASSEQSELRDLWADVGDEQWQASLGDLQKRLK